MASPETIENFIAKSGANEILADLKKHIAEEKAKGNDFIVSDVYDDQGNQYVDLVQEGGGVWGIALVGFTYILEEVGIRFFSLAGTSAGAINTMLLACTNEKNERKTKKIVGNLLDLDLFELVDGKPGEGRFTRWVKRVIQKFVTRKNYVRKVAFMTALILGLVTVASLGSFVLGIFYSPVFFYFSIAGLVAWALLIFLFFFFKYKIKKLVKTGYGLNRGAFFHSWMAKRLEENGILTLEDLKDHFSKCPPDLHVRPDKDRDIERKATNEIAKAPDTPMLTMIVSDITTGNKIEFPRMWDLYWPNKKDVHPADFVRASMSIPIFFETFKIKVSDKIEKPEDKWEQHINWTGKIPEQVQLVDGGVLSNFPINVFFNPDYIIPRMPTLGIRLSSGGEQVGNELKSIGEYVGSLVATLRANADKDFINKNKAFTLGIKEVPLPGHSWLNFFMKDEEKQQLFNAGATMAAEFLKGFDWTHYKQERLLNQSILQEQRMNPNNWED